MEREELERKLLKLYIKHSIQCYHEELLSSQESCGPVCQLGPLGSRH